jgi:L-ribulose-5-phosphate 3-epimerase
MAGLPLGVSTFSYIYTHSALDGLLHLADLGFRDFELVVIPPHIWPPDLDGAQRREIPRRLADRGLAIHSFCFPLDDNNLNSFLPEVRRLTLDMYAQVIDLAGEWQVPYVLLLPGKTHPFFPPPSEQMMDWLAEAIRELAPRAAGAGVQLLLENVPATFVPRSDDLMRAIDYAGEDSIGINLDIANARTAREDPAEAIRRVKDRLKLVHLADNDLTRHRKEAIGRGTLDFAPVADALREIGYDGFSMLEIITNDRPDEGIRESRDILARFGWDGAHAASSV